MDPLNNQKSRLLKLIFVIVVVAVIGGLVLFVPRRPSRDKATVELNVPAKAQVGQTVELPVRLTATKAINAAEFYIRYDQAEVAVTGFSKNDSIFTLWVLDTPKVTKPGEIWLAGGLPTPGFIGTGQVATIIFRPLKPGNPHFEVLDSSRVLLNDGKGTKLPLVSEVGKLSVGE